MEQKVGRWFQQSHRLIGKGLDQYFVGQVVYLNKGDLSRPVVGCPDRRYGKDTQQQYDERLFQEAVDIIVPVIFLFYIKG